jgi:DNA invertase Pin-like site-specific DNA recombinase
MNPSTVRYFLYARKSSESEDRQVASISSQIDELKKLAKEHDLEIIGILTEEKSAKAPGRPVFNQMLQDIHDKKADGILCWKLDRLARNPVDGGNISWMLQEGVIHHIQTYERSYFPSDHVLMMSVEFGMANQFIRDLSLNTKRGQRNKAQNGWLPTKAPIGYLNNKYNVPDKPPIYKDPQRFDIVRKLWDILLEKKCTLDEIYTIAIKMGLISYTDKAYARSSFHRLFRDPFYYGRFVWNRETHTGKHEPMITKTEFDLVQRILDGRGYKRKTSHVFAFTGLIRCGECGAYITAEDKEKHQKNGNIHEYTYYRCTKRIKRDCSQKPISKK